MPKIVYIRKGSFLSKSRCYLSGITLLVSNGIFWQKNKTYRVLEKSNRAFSEGKRPRQPCANVQKNALMGRYPTLTLLGLLLRGAIVNRTYGTLTNLYMSLLLRTVFGPVFYCFPVIGLQSRSEGSTLKSQAVCPQKGTAVLKGL